MTGQPGTEPHPSTYKYPVFYAHTRPTIHTYRHTYIDIVHIKQKNEQNQEHITFIVMQEMSVDRNVCLGI